MADNFKPLPHALANHASLTDTERGWLAELPHDELSKGEYHDLCVLVEAVLASRVPGYHLTYTQRHESALTATRGLCAQLLGPRGIAEPQKTQGFEWLMKPQQPKAYLAFYFRLRQLQREQGMAAARGRLIQDLDLHPTT